MGGVCSVNGVKDFLCLISVVTHEHFDALRVDVVSALKVVSLFDIRELISKALSVQVVFRIVSLMLNHMVRDQDGLEAMLLARLREVIFRHIAPVDAEIVVSIGHCFSSNIDLLQLGSIKSLLHSSKIISFINYKLL